MPIKAYQQHVNALCDQVAVDLRTEAYAENRGGRLIAVPDALLEQRWTTLQTGTQPLPGTLPAELPAVTSMLTLQIHRGAVACAAARQAALLISPDGGGPQPRGLTPPHDRRLLKGLQQSADCWAALNRALQAVTDKSEPEFVDALAIEAYGLAKSMDKLLLRSTTPTCDSLIVGVESRSRDVTFADHELYALARIMQSIAGHGLDCAAVISSFDAARDTHMKAFRKALRAGKATGDIRCFGDVSEHFTASQRAAVDGFQRSQVVSELLLESASRQQKKSDSLFDGFKLLPNVRQLPDGNVVCNDENSTALVRNHSYGQVLLDEAKNHILGTHEGTVSAFLRTSAFAQIEVAWMQTCRGLADIAVQFKDRARFIQTHTLEARLRDTFAKRPILTFAELTLDFRFTLPEELVSGCEQVLLEARRKQLSATLTERLNDLYGAIVEVYRDATEHDSIADELIYVLNYDKQRHLGDLRGRLDVLAAAVGKCRAVADANTRKGKRVPVKAAPEKPAPVLRLSMHDEDAAVLAQEELTEASPPCQPLAASPSQLPTAAHAFAAHRVEAPLAAEPKPWRHVRVNGRRTEMRTRLTNGQALAYINEHFYCGTLRSAAQAAERHYCKHVLRTVGDQPPGARPHPNVMVEDYIDAGLARSKDWLGVVTPSYSNFNIKHRQVDTPPKVWFTHAGQLVSYCYDGPWPR